MNICPFFVAKRSTIVLDLFLCFDIVYILKKALLIIAYFGTNATKSYKGPWLILIFSGSNLSPD